MLREIRPVRTENFTKSKIRYQFSLGMSTRLT